MKTRVFLKYFVNDCGYKLNRADNPNNIKRGGVCIYCIETLPVKAVNVIRFQRMFSLETVSA